MDGFGTRLPLSGALDNVEMIGDGKHIKIGRDTWAGVGNIFSLSEAMSNHLK